MTAACHRYCIQMILHHSWCCRIKESIASFQDLSHSQMGLEWDQVFRVLLSSCDDSSYIATTIFKTVVQRFYLWRTPIRPATWLCLHEVASGSHHFTPCSTADVEKSVISSVYIKMCAFYAKHSANSHYLATTIVQGDINLLGWSWHIKKYTYNGEKRHWDLSEIYLQRFSMCWIG